MSIFFNKKHYILIFTLIFFWSCQLQEPSKKHGILFLEKKSSQLNLNKHNKNDVIRIIGSPHSKSIDNQNKWIYLERVLVKGKLQKFGQNVLKTNNVLVLSFDKYGILKDKNFLNKDDINNLRFSKKNTSNDLATTSFIESFLNSIKSKMYSNRK